MTVNAVGLLGEPTGQGWTQLGELLFALVLCSLIGLERELKQKSAGLRTHTLVGLGSALFVLFSKYGFGDVLVKGEIMLDPSRVAAQIVSGIGFIGGGLIFVRRDAVRGLTTAAVVWVSAAVGCACAGGLPVLAAVVTAAHFLVVYGYPPLIRFATRSRPYSEMIRINYVDGRGVLRDVLALATRSGFTVAEVHTERRSEPGDEDLESRLGELSGVSAISPPHATIDLRLRLVGRQGFTELLSRLSELQGVLAVDSGEVDETTE
ncbi:MAG: MgtC/SapB family protein [Sciscionella sp.]